VTTIKIRVFGFGSDRNYFVQSARQCGWLGVSERAVWVLRGAPHQRRHDAGVEVAPGGRERGVRQGVHGVVLHHDVGAQVEIESKTCRHLTIL